MLNPVSIELNFEKGYGTGKGFKGQRCIRLS